MTRLLCWWLGHWWFNVNDLLPDGERVGRVGAVQCCRCPARREDWREWV